MKLENMRNMNRCEQIAVLKLIIKVAAADNNFTSKELADIKKFLAISNLRISKVFLKNSVQENTDKVISVFRTKSNLNRAYKIVEEYANKHGINPEYEEKVLNNIQNIMEKQKGQIKWSITNFVKTLFCEFTFLWGKEDMNPEIRTILAIIFTIAACVFGTFWTTGGFLGIGKSTDLVMPQFSAVICGLFVYGALSFRNYLPRPYNFQKVLFSIANLYLFSIICMHLLGRGLIEKGMTFSIFVGLIILLWLGLKEILGFVLLAFFGLFIYKIIAIDRHMAWRAFPFILSAFMGISFQSNNFFEDFATITNSYFKTPQIEKQLVKESIQAAGAKTKQVTKAAISAGVSAAAGLPPGAV